MAKRFKQHRPSSSPTMIGGGYAFFKDDGGHWYAELVRPEDRRLMKGLVDKWMHSPTRIYEKLWMGDSAYPPPPSRDLSLTISHRDRELASYSTPSTPAKEEDGDGTSPSH